MIAHVVEVEPLGSHRPRPRFDDGAGGDLDLSTETWDGVFTPLADPHFFDQVSVDEELGTTSGPTASTSRPIRFMPAPPGGRGCPPDLRPDFCSVPISRHDITDFEIVDHLVVDLTFADELAGRVDLMGRLHGPVFKRVRTPAGFREAYLDGGVLAWPGEVDFAPDTLYERVRTSVWPQALPA